MKQSKVLMVSVFITVVILVIAAGVTTTVMANNAAAQREEAYQQLIQQANDQLMEANAKLQEMQDKLAQVSPTQTIALPISSQSVDSQPTANDPAADYAVSTDQADQIALKTVELGSKQLKDPELVDFEGKAAYEIVFEKGSVFIDAQTGEVLFNGTVPQTISLEHAAQIAGDYTNDHNILQVDQVKQGTHTLYRVIFKNGNMAYLDMTGQILYINPAQPATPAEPQISTTSGSSRSGRSHSSGESDHGDD
jgi:uncharacterized membrane protein YkoI